MVYASGARSQDTPIRRSNYHRRPLLALQAVASILPQPRSRNATLSPFARFVVPRQARNAFMGRATRLEHHGLSTTTPPWLHTPWSHRLVHLRIL
jgi:hypothetical protein